MLKISYNDLRVAKMRFPHTITYIKVLINYKYLYLMDEVDYFHPNLLNEENNLRLCKQTQQLLIKI